MTITQDEIEKLSKPVAGERRRGAPALPTTAAGMESFATAPAAPRPPPAPRDHFDETEMTRAEFVELAKRVHPEAAEFTDQEIGDYAGYYMDDTLAETLRLVGLTMRDRLVKRAAGAPKFDDSKGLAEAAVLAEAEAAEALEEV